MKISAARSELDARIVEIELTLISIIQGVALTFLIETAREMMSLEEIIFWPYIVSGLFVILVFWSRSVLHVITLIRWPIEFGHNFLYIACALFEAILFTRLGKPMEWFVFSALFGAIGWVLFVYDLRLIHARERDSAGPASNRLCALVVRDQWSNIAVLVPGVFVVNVLFAVCIHARPDFWLGRHAHVWLAVAQCVGFAGYLIYVTRFYAKLSPLIAEARAEWRGESSTGDTN